jgi:choice-of-anchor B domain-containing protein
MFGRNIKITFASYKKQKTFMKKTLYTLMLLCIGFTGFSQNYNIAFRDSLHYNGTMSNICGIAINNTEYALAGWEHGMSIVNVNNPDSIYEVINIPGITSEWREVKTWGNYAYVTTEAGPGLQIVNLNFLPDSAPYHNYNGDGAIANQLQTIHALHIDAGYVYLFGSNINSGNAIICDLADPWNPVYMSQTPGSYIHDGYVRNDTLWAGHIYDGYFATYDCSNKANPVVLNTQATPGTFTHNTWLNDAGNVLFTTDEVNNSFLASYDVSNVNNIKLLDTYQTAPGSGAIVHNTHTVNDYEVVSWYTEGVVIVDGSRPSNLIEVGKYDSSPISTPGFNGDWGVYPFLPSGNLLLTDMEEGLLVVTPTYMRACYLEGIVTDSTTGNPINGATVQVLGKSISTQSNLTGDYKTGTVDSGTYDVQVSAFGYNTKLITGVVLSNGVLTNLNVELSSGVTITLTGNIFYNLNSSAIPNAKIRFTSGPNVIDATTDVSGNYTINNFVPGVYEVNIQKWGYQPFCQQNVNLVTAPFTQGLDFGIYDDFAFDWGWTATGNAATGLWDRAEPMGTVIQGFPVNAENDVTTDCGVECYATGNGTTDPFGNAVTDGYVLLTSPVFDGTDFVNPEVRYDRWVFNFSQNGPGNDTLWVRINNGTQTATLEQFKQTSPNSSWISKAFNISSLIPITTNMQVSFYTANQPNSFDLLEVAIDKFEVVSTPLAVNELNIASAVSTYPNPFTDELTINTQALAAGNLTISVYDGLGKLVNVQSVSNSGKIKFGSELQKGSYMIRVFDSSGNMAMNKIIKM